MDLTDDQLMAVERWVLLMEQAIKLNIAGCHPQQAHGAAVAIMRTMAVNGYELRMEK